MEQVAADVQDSQDFAPPQKRVRSEVLQDLFNEFRDGAPSRVISDHSVNNNCSNEQILRQVCFIIFSISLQMISVHVCNKVICFISGFISE